ncbi:hypothetical protein [Arthrobacter sp. RIT-PI-e]|nr:hypothetical protein [Arthrobacter sp. RIT-PI-e]
MTTDPAAPGSANRGTPRVLGTGRGRADRLAADDEGDGEDSAAPRH